MLFRSNRPSKDLVLVEGQPVKVGDASIGTILTPGHTPGSAGFIFPVKDKGKTRMAGLFGGSILTVTRPSIADMNTFLKSTDHFVDGAMKAGVEVEVQNHPIFDGMDKKLAALKSMKGNDPNPFVVGTGKYTAMFRIMRECIEAEVSRR